METEHMVMMQTPPDPAEEGCQVWLRVSCVVGECTSPFLGFRAGAGGGQRGERLPVEG